MKRHRRDYEMMADMNLTNLLDTAFVLLIAFIIASPTMRTGLKIDLPEVEKASIINTPDKSEPLIISIQKQRELPGQPEWVHVGEQRVTIDDPAAADSLTTMLRAKKALSVDKKLAVIVEADKDAAYGTIAKVLAALQNEQISDIGLPTVPLEPAQAAEPGEKQDQKKKS